MGLVLLESQELILRSIMNHDFLNQFCLAKNITLTPLRKDVLSILLAKNKPLRAYDILSKLKKKRANAEPPTVYRVLDFLVNCKIVHRIESQNSYVCCEQLVHHHSFHQMILLLCKKCEKSFEFENQDVFHAMKQFAKTHHLEIEDTLLEVKGICPKCLSRSA